MSHPESTAGAPDLPWDPGSASERVAVHGTRRLWTADQLVALCETAGPGVVERTGIPPKPYCSAVVAALPEPLTAALAALGDTFPDHSAMTYLVARPKGTAR